MSIASPTDSLSSGLSGVVGFSATQQKRAQASSDASNSDNTAQAAQFAAATPPVQLSGAGQLQASLSDLQGTANVLSAAFSVSPASSVSNTAAVAVGTAGTLVSTVGPQAPSPQSAGGVSARVGDYTPVATLNVSTGTFIPGTGQILTETSSAGNSSLLAANRGSAAASAQVLEKVLGFQIALTGTLGQITSAPQAAKAVANAAAAVAASGLSISQQSKAIATVEAAAGSSAQSQAKSQTEKVGGQAASNATPSVGALLNGAQALVSSVNRVADVAAAQPLSATAQDALANVTGAVANAQGSASSGQLTLSQVGITQGANGQLTIDQNKLQQAASNNPAGVGSVLGNAAQQLGQVASNSLSAPAQASDKATLAGASNGDNPYVVSPSSATSAQGGPNGAGAQTTLLAYAPSTQNLYGLAQYLSVSGL